MKWFFIVLTLVVALALTAALNAPASLVPLALAEMKKNGVLEPGAPALALSDTQGTVWNGSAQQAVLTLDGVEVPLGKLAWELSPLSLLDPSPKIALTSTAPNQTLKATIAANAQGFIQVSAMEGRLPISVLEPWFPLLVKGDIAFVVDHLNFTPGQLHSVDGVLNFEYVDWIGGDFDMPLGSYMAQVYNEGNEVFVAVNDFSARLGIDGMMKVKPDGLYTFDATLQPRSGLAPEVAESVAWLGKRQANGDVLINSRGRL